MKYLGSVHNRLFFLAILVLAILATSMQGTLVALGMNLFGGG